GAKDDALEQLRLERVLHLARCARHRVVEKIIHCEGEAIADWAEPEREVVSAIESNRAVRRPIDVLHRHAQREVGAGTAGDPYVPARHRVQVRVVARGEHVVGSPQRKELGAGGQRPGYSAAGRAAERTGDAVIAAPTQPFDGESGLEDAEQASPEV